MATTIDALETVDRGPGGAGLRLVPGGPRVDLAAAERAVADLLAALGQHPEEYDELVLARDIPFHSLCQHHMLPFTGVAHVGYLPGDRILGLSELARVVELFARGLQVQERLTKQVADWLQERLAPKGVGVVIEAEHLCMSRRGVQSDGSRAVTSALHGLLRTDPRSRAEFFALTGAHP